MGNVLVADFLSLPTVGSNFNFNAASSFPTSYPKYNPRYVTPRVLHIGPSNFFFGHMAEFADQLLNEAAAEGKPLDWGIVAVSLRTDEATRALQKQGGLYTLTSVGVKPEKHKIVGSVRDVMFAKGDAINAAIEAAAAPQIKIITMTVTEKGYSHTEPTVWSIDRTPGKGEELSTVEFIVQALNLRMLRGIEPPVVASMDNIAGNGRQLRSAVLARANYLAERGNVDPRLARWIENDVPFPMTMVDRITPNTREDNAKAMLRMGIETMWAIRAEHMPAMPLVIEDIKGGRQGDVFEHSGIRDLTKTGAVFAADVTPYEKLKKGIVNGSHMALGCAAHLCLNDEGGSKYPNTYEAMQNPAIRSYVVGFMDEVRAILPDVPGVDVSAFRDDVIARLDNPQMKDPVTRLARRGLEKVKGRVLGPMAIHSSNASIPRHITFAFAAWLHYVSLLDGEGYLPSQKAAVAFAIANGSELPEPNDAEAAMRRIPDLVCRNKHMIEAVFSNSDIFDGDVKADPAIIAAVKNHFETIRNHGMENALQMTFGGYEAGLHAGFGTGQGNRGSVHSPEIS